jgi:hypothetical protein
MDIQAVLADKQLKAKEKVGSLSEMLLQGRLSCADLINAARTSDDAGRGSCIEAIEFATRSDPKLASPDCLKFLAESLLDKAPRVRWESAKVIKNIAHLYPEKLDKAISNLLTNSEFPGTVVRWSAALALGEIVTLKAKQNKDLIPAVEAILRREDDKAIQKIYQKALKTAAKQ